MTTAPSSLVLGTSAQPVHPGCATPGSPRASWHREDHRVLVETRCPDCGATWTTEVPRDVRGAEATAADLGITPTATVPPSGPDPSTLAPLLAKAATAGWSARSAGSGPVSTPGAWRGVRIDESPAGAEPRGWVRLWKAGTEKGEPAWKPDGCWLLQHGHRAAVGTRDLDAALKAAQPPKPAKARRRG